MRTENIVKYKDEIMSRPKTEWHKSFREKKDLRKESKKDLKNLGSKFDESLTVMGKIAKLRDKKVKQKEAEKLAKVQSTSIFGKDKEARNSKANKVAEVKQKEFKPEPVKDKK